MEERQVKAAKSDTLRRVTAAQNLVARRAVELARRQLLMQTFRALAMHCSANQLLADRRAFRELISQAGQVENQLPVADQDVPVTSQPSPPRRLPHPKVPKILRAAPA